MNIATPTNKMSLRIWQENLNKSATAQHCILSGPFTVKEWDVVAIQEPVIDNLGNTKATPDWNVIYPSARYTHQDRSRAVTLVNKRINTNNWRQIPFPSSDVVVVQFTGPFGLVTMFNIYVDSRSRTTIPLLTNFLSREINAIRPRPQDHMLWIGDFNTHHFMWEEERNAHLCETAEAQEVSQQLIELVADHGMQMALPKNRPTLQSTSTGNWTRPDNVFCTDHTLNVITQCDTKPRRRPPCTDHVPILTTLELEVPTATHEASRNFKGVDWEEFNIKLSALLSDIPTPMPIMSEEQFQRAISDLLNALQRTIEENVPLSKPCPHAKRWWNRELTERIKEKDKLSDESYKLRGLPDHPVHAEHRRVRNKLKEEIRKAKQNHWTDYLEGLNKDSIYMANKYVTAPIGDGGRTSIPALKYQNPQGDIIEAVTNEEKSQILARSFFPPPPDTSTVPRDAVYPTPAEEFTPFSEHEIERTIAKTASFKAPGPDGICNIVFKRCNDQLTPYLTQIFNAVFTLDTYYDPWKEFTTVVLRKPGKADYTVPKAYCPIALLNTTCKLLTALVAQRTTDILERHNLLPNTHFGGRPGRTTTDSIHLLETIVKNAWRNGKVASILFLDIEGAFPNAVRERLIHNMRMRRLPLEIVTFTDRMLTGRHTQLRFNDTTSDWIPIVNGIGQGDPLSMIAYLIYCADLTDIAKPSNKETALAFVDDTAFIAVGKTFEETHATLADMMERPNGAMQWSKDHNSKFEVNKFALIDFSRNKLRNRPTLTIRNTQIKPAEHHRFLGLIVDQELTWKRHAGHAIAKGTEYVLQLRRLSRAAGGIPANLMRKLYLTVAVPKFTYGAGIWFRPMFVEGSNKRQRGSIGVAKRLASVQRMANISTLGAMRTTATDTLDAHALLLPMHLLLQKICLQAALRLATLPQRHPLCKHLQHAAKHMGVQRHRTSIHNLLAAFRALPGETETIDTVKHKTAIRSTTYAPHIATGKDKAIKEHEENRGEIKIYSDGSAHSGGVGAVAVLIRPGKEPRSLTYHLGSERHHTVYEAEIVGLTLAAKLLLTEDQPVSPVSIFIDNKAAIQSGASPSTTAGSYLIEKFARLTRAIAKKFQDQDSELQLTVRWIPGHKGVQGNELADAEAKRAAESPVNTSARRKLPRYLQSTPLPHSVSALKQWHRKALMEKWKTEWSTSPRYIRAKAIDPDMPSPHFLKLIESLPKKCASVYIQLRTNHAPLNAYLNRIGKRDSPNCQHCEGKEETAHHFLLDCPFYARERHTLAVALRRDATSFRYILTKEEATEHLMRYVNSTGRFKQTYGEITIN